jgi:hypothetical protein
MFSLFIVINIYFTSINAKQAAPNMKENDEGKT